MISRIVFQFLFIWMPSALASQNFTPPLPEEKNITSKLMEEIDGTRVLKMDLWETVSPLQTKILIQALSQEKTQATTPERKKEIQLIQGLLKFAEKNYDQALALFSGIEFQSPLYDLSLFLRAKALEQKANQYLNQKSSSTFPKQKILQACEESRNLLTQLQSQPSHPLKEIFQEQWTQSTLCYARGLLSLGQPEKAKPSLQYLLENPQILEPKDQERFLLVLSRLFVEERKFKEAKSLIQDGLRLFPQNSEFRKIESSLPPVAPETETSSVQPNLPEAKPLAEEDATLFKQIRTLQNKGKPSKTLDLFTQIFSFYPSSLTSIKAGAYLPEVLTSLLNRNELTSSLLKKLKEFPPKYLYQSARILWDQNKNKEAFELFEHLTKNFPFAPETGNSVYFLGRLHEDNQEWKKARDQFEKLVISYSTSSFYERAFFKVGWLSYLLQDYEKALQWLDYNRARKTLPYQRAEDWYWTWRTLEKMGKTSKAELYKKEIATWTPFSYSAFLTQQVPTLTEGKIEEPPIFSFQDQFRLYKAKALLSVGLPRLASLWLSQIQPSNHPRLILETAYWFSLCRDHEPSIRLALKFLQNFSGTSLPPKIEKILFPIEHEEIIQTAAKTFHLDEALLFSLIKQESRYRETATSRSGALGLMQVMPKTAQEISKEEGSSLHPSELLKGEKNVLIGAKYLTSLIKRFNGNIPYALASYNGGPQNVDLWIQRWGNLPIEEFIELIPFEETRNYVKIVLRNYFFYSHLLFHRTVRLSDLTTSSLLNPNQTTMGQ